MCSDACKATLRGVRVDMLFAPYGHDVPSRERSKDSFRPHTKAFACGRCVIFIPWTAGVNSFSGKRESGLRDEHADMRVAHGDAMVAHER